MTAPKPWTRHEYRDRKTRQIVAVEVVPENDLRRHVSLETCACLPALKDFNGAPMLIHNAFDGRELSERNNKEKGN